MSAITKQERINRKIAAGVSKMTPERIDKLKQVFALDGTVKEACFYAEIDVSTYYAWIQKHPELSKQFDALREKPVLAARQTIVSSLNNPDHAFRYLASKRKDEFGPTTKVEHAGRIETVDGTISDAARAVAVRFEDELRATIAEGKKKPE